MKFVSARHPLFSLGILVCILLLIAGGVLAIMSFGITGKIIMLTLDVVFIAMFVWIYLSTYYELRDDELYIHSGPFSEHIKYENIKSVTKKRGYSMMCTLAFDRIEIRHRTDGMLSNSYVSPLEEDEFLRKLELKRM